MRLAVFDTETTGLGEQDQVVELAVVTAELHEVTVEGRKYHVPEGVALWSTLIRPTVPVQPDARAAHHITDEELAEAPTMAELLERRGLPELEGDVVVAAHNLDFDYRMMLQSGYDIASPKICTWRLSRHLYADAGSFSNQFLRYYLDLQIPELSQPPHRATPDAVVTFYLLHDMLTQKTLPELLDLCGRPALLTTCTVGRDRGKPWSEVDVGMLRWILARDFDADVKHTCRHWLKVHQDEAMRRRETRRAQREIDYGEPGTRDPTTGESGGD